MYTLRQRWRCEHNLISVGSIQSIVSGVARICNNNITNANDDDDDGDAQ